jgi:hypothetical protein
MNPFHQHHGCPGDEMLDKTIQLTLVADRTGSAIVLAIIASILGAGSVLALVRRIWRLVEADSTCRPPDTVRYHVSTCLPSPVSTYNYLHV